MNRMLIVPVVLLSLMGGPNKDLESKTRYDHIDRLTRGDSVVLENSRMERATRVSLKENGDDIVDISVIQSAANTVMKYYLSLIAYAAAGKGGKVVDMLCPEKGGERLAQGAPVEEPTKPPETPEESEDDLYKRLDDLRRQFNELAEDLKKIPESEKFQEIKKELERLSGEIKRLILQGWETLEKDVLIRLKERMEELRKRLEELMKEQEEKKDENKPIQV